LAWPKLKFALEMLRKYLFDRVAQTFPRLVGQRSPAVPIDNNVSEREMKRVVLNWKNSLFVGNPRGGRTAAIFASLNSNLPPPRYRSATLFYAAAGESPFLAGKQYRCLAP
jgi:hypothetical protein